MLRSTWQRCWRNDVCVKSVQSGGMTLRARLWLVALDRHEIVEKKAHDAQVARDNNDVRCCFAVVRALSGGKPRAQKTILKKNGENTHKENQRKERWHLKLLHTPWGSDQAFVAI